MEDNLLMTLAMTNRMDQKYEQNQTKTFTIEKFDNKKKMDM